jgi:hypothetical protein
MLITGDINHWQLQRILRFWLLCLLYGSMTFGVKILHPHYWTFLFHAKRRSAAKDAKFSLVFFAAILCLCAENVQ